MEESTTLIGQAEPSPERPVRHFPLHPGLERRVGFLLDRARQIILRRHRRDSCVFSTRVVCEVMKDWGFAAQPMAVLCAVFNPALAQRLSACLAESGGTPPPRATIRRWQFDGSRCWAIGLGYPREATAPDHGVERGHLVALVERRIIIDLSLEQANRPQHRIELRPLAFDATPALLAGARPMTLEAAGGCVLRYERDRGRPGWFKHSRDWTSATRYTPVVAEIGREFTRWENERPPHA